MNIARLMRIYRSPDENAGGGNPNEKPKDGGKPPEENGGKEEILADLKKWKEKARTLEAEKETSERKKLEESQQWKDLYEREKTKREELETNNKRLSDSYINERKYSALKDSATKLGLRAEAMSDLELLDLGRLQVETTNTGKMTILGAEKFAEQIKTLKPHWFGGNPPNVNTKVPRVDADGEMSPEKIYELEKEGRKSGDMSKYRAAIQQYQKRGG